MSYVKLVFSTLVAWSLISCLSQPISGNFNSKSSRCIIKYDGSFIGRIGDSYCVKLFQSSENHFDIEYSCLAGKPRKKYPKKICTNQISKKNANKPHHFHCSCHNHCHNEKVFEGTKPTLLKTYCVKLSKFKNTTSLKISCKNFKSKILSTGNDCKNNFSKTTKEYDYVSFVYGDFIINNYHSNYHCDCYSHFHPKINHLYKNTLIKE